MALSQKAGLWFVVILVALGMLLTACSTTGSGSTAEQGKIQVVAAENFYGDIVQQIGGSHVQVTSLLDNPNIDPHTYESSVHNAKLVARARIVIENGGGYDSWMDKLLASSPSESRIVLKGYDLASTKLPDNEHVWYSIDNAQTLAGVITNQLKQLDAANAPTFEQNFQTFKQSLNSIRTEISTLKATYNGTPVGLTETIFQYQAIPLGLNILTPPDFQKAMAEGNDPPANTVVTVENQVLQKQIRVLVYNEQATSALTARLQSEAQAQHIPVIPITELMPVGGHYQSWMLDQLHTLKQGLAQSHS